MRIAVALSGTMILVLAGQIAVLAQSLNAAPPRTTDIVISSGTAVLVALIGSIGTVIAAFLGSWGAIKIQVATLQATCQERTKAICHTLDDHQRELDRLRDRIDG